MRWFLDCLATIKPASEVSLCGISNLWIIQTSHDFWALFLLSFFWFWIFTIWHCFLRILEEIFHFIAFERFAINKLMNWFLNSLIIAHLYQSVSQFGQNWCIQSRIMQLRQTQRPSFPVAHLFVLTHFYFIENNCNKFFKAYFGIIFFNFLPYILKVKESGKKLVKFHCFQAFLEHCDVSWEGKSDAEWSLCRKNTCQCFVEQVVLIELNHVDHEGLSITAKLKNCDALVSAGKLP